MESQEIRIACDDDSLLRTSEIHMPLVSRAEQTGLLRGDYIKAARP